MRRTRLFLITALGALAVPLLAASGAQADVASCATTGAAGPITPGVQAIQPDLATTGADSLAGDPLSDTDNGTRHPATGWEDGVYEFHGGPESSLCIYVDETDPVGPFIDETGVFPVQIDSNGAYDNTVCGTGLAIDRGAVDATTVTGAGEDITDADYQVTFAAGNGPIQITKAETSGGNTLTGDGAVHIAPEQGFGNCVTQDVTRFSVAASFTADDH